MHSAPLSKEIRRWSTREVNRRWKPIYARKKAEQRALNREARRRMDSRPSSLDDWIQVFLALALFVLFMWWLDR